MKFTFKKNNLKIVLIVVVTFAIAMSIVLGVDFVINKIREGVVRGTLELRDYPPIYENHSTQQVWVTVALEEIYPPLVYYLTEDYELVASMEKYGDFEEGTHVQYKIIAYDKANNPAVEDKNGEYYVYKVIPEFQSLIILILMITTSIAVILTKTRNRTHYMDRSYSNRKTFQDSTRA